MKDVKVEGLFRDVKYPIELFDKNGNSIYLKNSEGYSWISEFDKNGNEIIKYFRNSDGFSWMSEYDKNGNEIYFRNSDGFSCIREFDENNNNNCIYSKDSDGLIRDNRPKKKYTVRELEKLIGIDNIEIVKE